MSAPLAGKFQDHYKVLTVDVKSDSETISKAYGRLAQKYHPRNADTGDQENGFSVQHDSTYESQARQAGHLHCTALLLGYRSPTGWGST